MQMQKNSQRENEEFRVYRQNQEIKKEGIKIINGGGKYEKESKGMERKGEKKEGGGLMLDRITNKKGGKYLGTGCPL